MNRWSNSAFTVPWKRRVILVHHSSNYWCPISLCIISLFMVLGLQREILLRSREYKQDQWDIVIRWRSNESAREKTSRWWWKKDDLQGRCYTNCWRGVLWSRAGIGPWRRRKNSQFFLLSRDRGKKKKPLWGLSTNPLSQRYLLMIFPEFVDDSLVNFHQLYTFPTPDQQELDISHMHENILAYWVYRCWYLSLI